MSSITGGSVKKAYEPIDKKSVCGKERVIYKKVYGAPTKKLYMKKNGKFVQVKNFEAAMIAAGKWKAPKKTTTKKKSPKPCKEDQHRNPATGRCVKNKVAKSPKKKGRPRKISKRSARHSNRQGSY
tara:strand:+ start:96 stop:473 length:378 start_codon:yes stop_codon:yes gene_type:complete